MGFFAVPLDGLADLVAALGPSVIRGLGEIRRGRTLVAASRAVLLGNTSRNGFHVLCPNGSKGRNDFLHEGIAVHVKALEIWRDDPDGSEGHHPAARNHPLASTRMGSLAKPLHHPLF